MLGDLMRRLSAGLVTTVMIAVAAGIALVAASFAIYAAFRMFASPAAASALTAGVFAVIAALISVIAPKLIHPNSKSHSRGGTPDAATMRLFAELGITALGVVADLAVQKRPKDRDTRRGARHSHR